MWKPGQDLRLPVWDKAEAGHTGGVWDQVGHRSRHVIGMDVAQGWF